MTDDRFDGTSITVPFGSERRDEVVRGRFESFLEDHHAEEILVISGSPTSMETYREILEDTVPGAAVPRVTSPVVHATSIVNRTDDRAILSDVLRRELVREYLEDVEFDSEYLQHASRQESFASDLAALMETIAWQVPELDTTPELIEVGGLVDGFHSWLDEHDHLERGQLIAEAASVLEAAGPDSDLLDFEAVLALEFEEFFSLDRRYLSVLSEDRDLVCISTADSSVRRTWVEPGQITDLIAFDRHDRVEDDTGDPPPESRPLAAATFFARGEVPEDPEREIATVVASETPDDQLAAVADEIEHLQRRPGWDYDDVAVGLKGRGDAVTETVRELERAGIPTRSATTVGFGDDPAVRELVHVARYFAADADDRDERRAAHPALVPELLETVVDTGGLEDCLRQWATESELKRRIAEREPPLDARARFGNVTRAFEMASFVEDTPFLEPSWDVLATVLERAHDQSPQFARTSAIERDGGVRVDDVQSLKNGSFRAVFLLNVVDSNYPGDPFLSPLFPRERLARMPDYPGVTDVDESDVRRTFGTESTAAAEPFRQYHAEHARRLLATGAATATDRVYLCFYTSEGAGLDRRVQPSRFLTGAVEALPWIGPADETEIRSERAAEEYLLSLVDRTLAEIRGANSRAVEVSLDDVESDLLAIHELLAESGERGEALREAMRARIDLAEGRVRRE